MRNCTVIWDTLAQKVYISCLKRDFFTRICSCIKRKALHIKPVAALGTSNTTQAMEIVSIDFFCLDHCSGGYEYFLVVTDQFMGYTQTYPTKTKPSRTAGEKIFIDFILRFDIPKHILHDQGKEFDNKPFNKLTKLCGVEELRTSLCTSQTNGAVERMNYTICSMLKTLASKENTTWKYDINKMISTYYCKVDS